MVVEFGVAVWTKVIPLAQSLPFKTTMHAQFAPSPACSPNLIVVAMVTDGVQFLHLSNLLETNIRRLHRINCAWSSSLKVN